MGDTQLEQVITNAEAQELRIAIQELTKVIQEVGKQIRTGSQMMASLTIRMDKVLSPEFSRLLREPLHTS
jgi:hypothetical protein